MAINYDDAQIIEVPDLEAQTFTEKLIRSAPWWIISITIHGIAACILAFVLAVTPQEEKHEMIIISARQPPPEIETKEKEIDKQIEIEKTEEIPINEISETPEDKTFDKPLEEYKSDKPFKGKGFNDAIGASGGAGGFGGRRRGKGELLKKGGGSGKTEDAVLNALRWLARHQNPDGSWSATNYNNNCGKVKNFSGNCLPAQGSANFDVGVTGLALLAFLGAGYTHLSNEVHDGINFGHVVKKGVQYLISIQDPSGRIGPDSISKYMYNHLIAGFALVEAYGMTNSPNIKEPAQKAVRYTVEAQNPGKAFRYSYRSGDNDSSVSGWAAQLFKSAELSKIEFPHEAAYNGIMSWYNEVTETKYYWVGYTNVTEAVDRVPTVIKGVNEDFANHPALAAIALMSKIFITHKKDNYIEGYAARIIEDLPEWDKDGKKVDFYYWYYATFAMYQYDGPDGSKWKKWNQAILTPLVEKQNTKKSECKHGSWEPVDRWGSEGGRVYTTAAGALTLEVYYRYPSATMQRK